MLKMGQEIIGIEKTCEVNSALPWLVMNSYSKYLIEVIFVGCQVCVKVWSFHAIRQT